MRGWRLLMLLAAMGPVAGAQAQEALLGRHHVGMQAALAYEVGRDEQASPLRYSGRFHPVRVTYGFRGDRVRHHAEFEYGFVVLTSSISGRNAHRRRGPRARAHHSVLWRLTAHPDGRLQLHAGAGVTGRWRFDTHRYAAEVEETFALGSVAFGPTVSASFASSRVGKLRAQMLIPAGAVVIRAPYSTKGRLDSRMYLPGSYAAGHVLSEYRYRVARGIDFVGRLTLEYEYVAEPVPTRTLHRSVALGFIIE